MSWLNEDFFNEETVGLVEKEGAWVAKSNIYNDLTSERSQDVVV